VQDGDRAAAEAQQQLGALDGRIRQVARTAFTGDGMTELDLLMTSESPEDFISSAGHPSTRSPGTPTTCSPT
jgi:hypothetical protein